MPALAAPARSRTRSRPGCSSGESRESVAAAPGRRREKPKSARVASRSPRGGSRSNAFRSVTAAKPRFSSCTRRVVVDRDVERVRPVRRDAGRRRQPGTLPREIVMVEHDAAVVLREDGGRHRRRVRIDRQRAEVLHHDQVGTGDGGREHVGFGRTVVDRVDREGRYPRVVGAEPVVELARDATHVETELVERPLPLAGLDRRRRRRRRAGTRVGLRRGARVERLARITRSADQIEVFPRSTPRDDGWWHRAARAPTASSRSRRTTADPETTSSVGGST